MKYAALLVLLLFVQGSYAQAPKQKSPTGRKQTAAKPKPVPTPTPLTEKEQFDRAMAHELATARVVALEKFLSDFPQSENRSAAVDLLTSSRGLIAEEKLLSGDAVEAVQLFKLVVAEAPQPVPDELFNESIAKIPSTLFRRGHRESAFELAGLIEAKVESSTRQLLEIANFYITIENGAEAMRVAAKAAAKDPNSPAVYRTLALAHRINFELEESANAYAKALELEPGSAASTRGLAEMKRALGKSDEAAALYRELLAKNEADLASRTGLVLSLFDAGKRVEAETELASTLEKAPANFVLLAGASYWYASKGIGDKAVELAEKALAREPRYIWSHIALARGLIAQGKPVAAEQVLVKARAYGNFPTLEYELASARVAAGFYREAAEDLARHFVISPAGVRAHLGGRVSREEKSLFDLVAYERRASIFTPGAADTADNAEVLRALLEFDQKLNAASTNEADISSAVDAFVKGTDKMKLHRQLHAASLLLQKRVAIAKALELVKAATGNTDAALEVATPGAAVMASELYDSRATAFRANEFLIVPEVPKQTLSSILRGRIEEMAGWALYLQGSYPEAIVRLRRAITVMPDKSAWWRSSMWRLGAALAADGKDTEALNAYIDSYKTDRPDFGKYAVVESLYRKVHGSIDGLDTKIGPERVAVMQSIPQAVTPAPIAPAPGTSATDQTASPAAAEPAVKAVSDSIGETAKTVSGEKEKAAPVETSSPIKSEAQPIETASPIRTDSPTVEIEKNRPTAYPIKIDQPVTGIEEKRPDELAKQKEAAITPPTPVIETKSSPIASEKAKTTAPPVVIVETKLQPTSGDADKVKDESAPAAAEPKTELPTDRTTEKLPDKRVSDPPVETPRTARTKESVKVPPSGTKLLFEPIIIKIPVSKPVKLTAATDENKKSDSTDVAKTSAGPEVRVFDTRPRLIEGQEIKVDEPEPCTIGLSQDSVSLINGGGTVGILVHVEEPGDIRKLTVSSSSPKDVEVTAEPEIGGMPDRRFFVIRSVSSSLGVYQVLFATPCGKKNLIVTVR